MLTCIVTAREEGLKWNVLYTCLTADHGRVTGHLRERLVCVRRSRLIFHAYACPGSKNCIEFLEKLRLSHRPNFRDNSPFLALASNFPLDASSVLRINVNSGHHHKAAWSSHRHIPCEALFGGEGGQ